jgi:hypothetical protein
MMTNTNTASSISMSVHEARHMLRACGKNLDRFPDQHFYKLVGVCNSPGNVEMHAEKICNLLDLERDPESGDRFVSAAGWDHGFVRAWNLGRFYLVSLGLGGVPVEYFFGETADKDSLTNLLARKGGDLDPIDRIVYLANVLGVESIDGADENEEGPFYVLKTRYPHGLEDTSAVLQHRNALKFASYKAAQAWIDDDKAESDSNFRDYGGHYGGRLPSYKIVTV